MNKYAFLFLIFLLVIISPATYGQRVVRNEQFKFELKLPDSLIARNEFDDESDTVSVYYDPTPGVVLMISGRKSLYKDINSYLDCSKQGLEKQLQEFQGDSTLQLVSCNKSAYYPDKSVVLHFETAAYSPQLTRCIIYFFHYKKKEVQFFFLYNKANKESLSYIDKIMQSLVLL
jgi:hypothetical protein